jgi:flagellar biosynthesis protein FlhA
MGVPIATAAAAPSSAGKSSPLTPGWSKQLSKLFLPIAAISLVFIMLVPLPAFVLDLLLALSLTASVIVFLSALQLQRAVDFSIFPTMLLLLTLMRLSLNLASSRRILLHGHEGTAAAGSIIEAFGQFVVGGNYVVGFVLFLALIAIQFLVVSHGAVRTAEVTARFTLDALPGKQMAIDADLNAGLIDEAGARHRREAIAREAEFYGAMDGSARFTQRDALATILITAINIAAGFAVGVLQQGMPLVDALRTYTILTVGDGLVTMIPSLLVSVAGGIVLTRASAAAPLGNELGKQLFNRPTTLWVAAGVLLLLGLVPGMPKIAFLVVAVGLGMGARAVGRRNREETARDESAKKPQVEANASTENLAAALKLDELCLEIGFQLIPLVDEKQGGMMLQRVRALRKHLAQQLGFIVPSVHITDNLRLRPREYSVLLRGVEIGKWELEAGCVLAVSNEPKPRVIQGKETSEPAFGVAARWIDPKLEDTALAAGYSVVDQTTVIATHLGELMRKHAQELLSRSETKRLLDTLNDSHPRLVEELVPKLLTLGEVQRVLQQLLREGVSIRNLGAIMEALVETAQTNKSMPALVESARQALGRSLVQPLLAPDGTLRVFTINPQIEDQVIRVLDGDSLARTPHDPARPDVSGNILRKLVEALKPLIQQQPDSAIPVLLCSSPARYHLRRWLEPFAPRLAVVAPAEIPSGIQVRSAGVVS